MGFNQVRKAAIDCLLQGNFQHEPRKDILRKNFLFAGRVTTAMVIEMIKGCSGSHYEMKPHDADASVNVHILEPRGKYDGWYIKFYFVADGAMFISVHQ